MKYVAKNERRISRAVMLRVKLEVVSRPGVLFSDCNATRKDSTHSQSLSVVRFDVVKAANHFAVAPELAHFYQAEVLVPSPLPPHLILFPDDKFCKSSKPIASKHKTLEGGDQSKPKLPCAESAKSCETRRCSSAASSPALVSSFSSNRSVVAEGAAASLVSQDEVLPVRDVEGPRLIAEFIAWFVSVLMYDNIALVAVLFFAELNRSMSRLPLLYKLRLRSVFELSRVIPTPIVRERE